MEIVIKVVILLSLYSALPAIWLGFRQRGILWYYAVVSFLCDMASHTMIKVFHSEGRWTGNVFYLLELLLIGIYFSKLLFSGRWQRAVMLVTIGIGIWFIASIHADFNVNVNYETTAVMYLLFISFCLIALYRVLRNVDYTKIERSPLFTFAATF